MIKAEDMRRNAENCLDLAADAASLAERLRYLRMAHAWEALADCQTWLDTEPPPNADREALSRH
jgi:hypothetical protein